MLTNKFDLNSVAVAVLPFSNSVDTRKNPCAKSVPFESERQKELPFVEIESGNGRTAMSIRLRNNGVTTTEWWKHAFNLAAGFQLIAYTVTFGL